MKLYLHYFVFIFLVGSIQLSRTQPSADLAGIITYKYKPNMLENNDVGLNGIFNELDKQAENISFSLIFKGFESFFEVEGSMENDYAPIAMSYANAIISKGKYYTNLQENEVVREFETLGEKFLISSEISISSDWVLTKETKKIGNFLCFKALKQKTIENSIKKTDFEIIAWYTPELPVRFGPRDYNGLPGLILELTDTHFTFYVEKVQILNEKTVEMKRIKGKSLSYDEYQRKIQSFTGKINISKN
ncbi:MAG: GLPGLI family protein [Bacteroidota bacterium]